MNARWQRWLVAAHWTVLALWLAWWWPRSPAWALAGWVLVPLASRLALVPQFVLAAWVGRHDPSPRPGALQWIAAWARESHWAALVFGWWQPFRSNALPDALAGQAGRRGVVLVHGLLCNRGFWTPWLRLLRARGHAVVAVTLEPPFSGIDGYAPAIDAAVRRVAQATGRAPLVVGHSMGGLAVRAWLRAFHDADARACRVVTIGSPHHGAWTARGARSANGVQMAPGSAWLRALAAQEPPARRAAMVCWASNADNVVYPPSTAHLEGADNRWRLGVPHITLAFDREVLQHCLQLLDAPDAAGGENAPRQWHHCAP